MPFKLNSCVATHIYTYLSHIKVEYNETGYHHRYIFETDFNRVRKRMCVYQVIAWFCNPIGWIYSGAEHFHKIRKNQWMQMRSRKRPTVNQNVSDLRKFIVLRSISSKSSSKMNSFIFYRLNITNLENEAINGLVLCHQKVKMNESVVTRTMLSRTGWHPSEI